MIIPCHYAQGHVFFEIDRPTLHDMDTLPIIHLTPNEPWDVSRESLQTFDISNVQGGLEDGSFISNDPRSIWSNEEEQFLQNESFAIQAVTLRHNRNLNNDTLRRWQEHLNLPSLDITKKTLKATTQLAVIEYNPTLTRIRPHVTRRLLQFRSRRLDETCYTDPLIIPMENICKQSLYYKFIQIFYLIISKYIFLYPMRSKSEFFQALQCFVRDVGIPFKLISDNAPEESSKEVRIFCLKHKIKQGFSEPHHQHQNYAEHAIRDVKASTTRLLRSTGCPKKYWWYVMQHAVDMRNHTVRRSITGNRTPYEVVFGNTPDISVFFYFKFWDPVRYITPAAQRFPNDQDQTGRFIGIARTTGDELTYKILVDNKDVGDEENIVLTRSSVYYDDQSNRQIQGSRFYPIRGDEDQDNETIEEWNEDLENISFQNPLGDLDTVEEIDNEDDSLPHDDDEGSDSETVNTAHSDDTDLGANIDVFNDLATITDSEVNGSMHQLYTDESTLWEVEYIIGHRVKKNKPYLKVRWITGETTWEPFDSIRKDIPDMVAKYIIDKKLKVPYKPQWARTLLPQLNVRNVTIMRNKKKQRTQRILYGVVVPDDNNVQQAYERDRIEGNTLWADAIKAEMKAFDEHKVFRVWKEKEPPKRENGWQFSKILILFTVKPDGRRKCHMVLGGHMTEAGDTMTHASTVKTANVKLLIHIAVINDQDVIIADIGTAYLNARTKELIWIVAGPEFGPELQGKILILEGALYGAKGSANAWFLKLSDYQRSQKFTRSTMDMSLWYKYFPEADLYNYFCHHVDDILDSGPGVQEVINNLKKSFTLTGADKVPDSYLGINLEVLPDGSGWLLSSRDYITKILPMIEDIIGKKLGKQSTPTTYEWQPEIDETPLLIPSEVKKYQKVLGVGIWLSITTRPDVTFSIGTLSRYTHIARQGHMKSLIRVFEYLHKHKNLGLKIDGSSPPWAPSSDEIEEAKKNVKDLKEYYPDVKMEWNPSWPKPKGKPIQISVFVDADHASNTADRRSITGIRSFLDNTLYKWKSKRQTSVTESTYAAELMALRDAAHHAIEVTHMLQSIGVPLAGPAWIFVDNNSAFLNTTIAGSDLKKKHLSIAYHIVREGQAAGYFLLFKVDTKMNLADLDTKGLTGMPYWSKTSYVMFKPNGHAYKVSQESNTQEE